MGRKMNMKELVSMVKNNEITSKIAKETAKFKYFLCLIFKFLNLIKVLKVRFLNGSESHVAFCCPLPLVCLLVVTVV